MANELIKSALNQIRTFNNYYVEGKDYPESELFSVVYTISQGVQTTDYAKLMSKEDIIKLALRTIIEQEEELERINKLLSTETFKSFKEILEMIR